MVRTVEGCGGNGCKSVLALRSPKPLRLGRTHVSLARLRDRRTHFVDLEMEDSNDKILLTQ